MVEKRTFTELENANAILNGMEDCCDEFVETFTELHQQPIDNEYMYDWIIRSLLDVSKINQSVLYVACGTAGYSRLFKNTKRFVGIDLSQKMVNAAKRINTNPSISFDFYCTPLEKFITEERFDIIYMGPYGHNVPYSDQAFEKAKNLLAPDGMIFCTLPEPNMKGLWQKTKEFIKQILTKGIVYQHPITKLEKMLSKHNLEIYLKLRLKTSLGHAFCYITKKK